jgi:hypothetical protein
MPLNPYVERIARVTVTVQRPNAQGTAASQTYVFINNRMKIRLRDGGANFGNCRIEIYGVPLADMNQIARLYLMPLTPQNTDTVNVDIWDGNTQQFVPLFQGVVSWSAIAASGMPHVALVIESNSSFALMIASASPYANGTPVSLQDVLTAIATPVGYTVDYSTAAPQYMIQRVRLTGSPMDQINTLMRSFPDLTFNVHLQRLIVRPANAPYSSSVGAVAISAATGMQAAPEYGTNGVTFSTLFNAQIVPGASLAFTTQFSYLNQTQWVAAVLQHDLEPNVFNGKWTSSIAACAYGVTGNAR